MFLQALGSVSLTMLQGIRGVGSVLAGLPFRVKFGLVWLLAVIYLLYNAEAFYGAERAATQTSVLLLYVASLAFVFSATPRGNPLMGVSTAEFIVYFGMALGAGVVLLKSVGVFAPPPAPPLSRESIGALLTHALVVATGEELLFRHAIPGLIPGPPAAAQTLSAAAFGVMHYSAYGGSVPAMLWAGVLGLLFGVFVVLYRGRGLMIAMGLHTAYNLYVLGYL